MQTTVILIEHGGLERGAAPTIHLCATSDIHLEHKLRKSRKRFKAGSSGKTRQQYTSDVNSPQRCLTQYINYLCEVVEAAIEARATVVNIPDTVGYAVPMEFGEFIEQFVSGSRISIR